MEYYLLYAICCTSRFPKPKVRYDVETISPLLTIVVLFKLELTCILILLLLVFIRNGINEPAEVLPFYGSIFTYGFWCSYTLTTGLENLSKDLTTSRPIKREYLSYRS